MASLCGILVVWGELFDLVPEGHQGEEQAATTADSIDGGRARGG